MKAILKEAQVKEATSREAVLLVSYEYIPRGNYKPDAKPVSSRQEISIFENQGRLYLKGRDGRLGYWDKEKGIWYPWDRRQEYLEEVIKATVKTAQEAMEAEKKRLAALRERVKK